MHYRLVECARCDLLYANPAPPEPLLVAAYEDAAYESGEESAYAARTYAQLLPPIISRLPALQGALDIGAGDGAFIQRLIEAGFTDVVGVEPSRAPILVADERIKPLIREGPFRVGDFEPGRFDLVTCFQTLEHLHEPREVFAGLPAILAQGGGVLVVCHDRRALSARLLGRRSPIYDVEHLQLFSPNSLRYLMTTSGFTDVEVKPLVNRYPLHYWAKLAPFPSGAKAAVLERLRKSRLGGLELALRAGNLAAVGYRS